MPGPRIEVEDDPTPLVLALRTELIERLTDPEFAALTGELAGTAAVRVAESPEAVRFSFGDLLTVRHGAGGAEATATIGGRGRWDGLAIAGEAEHPELARWLRALTAPPERPWRVAAARFWERLEGWPGAPSALLVVNLESDERERFGNGSRAYEIHARPEPLVAVLEGRAPLIAAAFEREIYIRGSFAEISVLSGAALRVRLGAGAGDA